MLSYRYSEQTRSLIGERTRRCYGMGDRVRVVVERVNVDKRQIDFKTVKGTSESKGKGESESENKGKSESKSKDVSKGRGNRGRSKTRGKG